MLFLIKDNCSADNSFPNIVTTFLINCSLLSITPSASFVYEYILYRTFINSNLNTTNNKFSSYLPLNGGTLTGNLTGQYLTGTWLQTTSTSNLGYNPGKIAVLDGSGWIYYRTTAQVLSDIGGMSANGGTVSGNLKLEGTDSTRQILVQNSFHTGGMLTSSTANFGLYDTTYTKWLVKSDKDGVVNYAIGTMGGANILTSSNFSLSGTTLTITT